MQAVASLEILQIGIARTTGRAQDHGFSITSVKVRVKCLPDVSCAGFRLGLVS